MLDFPSARVSIGSKLVWEYIGMPSRITTRVSYSLFSAVGSKVISNITHYNSGEANTREKQMLE